MGKGGLSIIQDENDSNQDSDFSGDEEDKKKTETGEPNPNGDQNLPGEGNDMFDNMQPPQSMDQNLIPSNML